MATYTSDLTSGVIYEDTSAGTWTLISSGGGGQNALTDPETDDYIQGSNGISRNPWSSAIRGVVYSNGAFTVDTNDAVWIWAKADVAQALDTKANGGIQCLIGSGTGALKTYYVSGKDDPFGGWKCYPIDPTVTSGSADIGSPTTTTSHVGVRWNVPSSGPSKGFPFKIDAIRHGRFLTVTGDTPDGTFDGAATFQGDLTRQWGQFQFQNGTYLWQGGFQIGTSATSCSFTDSNRTIFVANTEFVSSGFNRMEVNNTGTTLDLSNISISALGSVSRGDFEVVDNATVTLNSFTFVDMGTFIFNGGANSNTIQDCVFRRCQTVTQGGAAFTGCTFDRSNSSTAFSADDIDTVTSCTFISDGTGHAVDLGTISSDTTVVWNNKLTSVATEWSGSTGVTSGVSGTANDAVLVNVASGITLTLSVSTGASIPTVRNTGSGSVDIQAGNVTFTVTVLDGSVVPPVAITDGSVNVYVEAGTGGPLTAGTQIIKSFTNGSGVVTDTRSWASNQPVVGWARRASTASGALPSGTTYFKTGPINATIDSAANSGVTVVLQSDE